jgi:hypothetical protein
VQDTTIKEHFVTKDHYLFGYISDFIFITEFQNLGSKHDHEFLWIKNSFMYGMHTNEKIERFVDIYIFLLCIIVTKPITKCTTTLKHKYM